MNQPAKLMKNFYILSLLSIILILSLVSVGIFNIYRNNIVKDAEEDAFNLGKLIFDQEKDLLTSKDSSGNYILSINSSNFLPLNNRMLIYLSPLNMYKIKVFSLEKEIIYSTENQLIGQQDLSNNLLRKAFSGEVQSNIKKKEEPTDLEGEKKLNIDVVEVYFPIKLENGEILGAAEVYVDVTRYREQIRQVLISSITILLFILLLTFGILCTLMKFGTKQLEKVQEKLEILTITDDLTQIYNRRFLLSRAEEEFSKIKRLGGESPQNFLGLIILDIDHFKQINDKYGHHTGDEILKLLAQRLTQSVRNYDIVGRLGGEEFLILLPNTNLENTNIVATKVWEKIREKPFEINGKEYIVTISIGIACAGENDSHLVNVLKKADEILYKAKNKGRDRVEYQ